MQTAIQNIELIIMCFSKNEKEQKRGGEREMFRVVFFMPIMFLELCMVVSSNLTLDNKSKFKMGHYLR
jgi:hypothetical protein